MAWDNLVAIPVAGLCQPSWTAGWGAEQEEKGGSAEDFGSPWDNWKGRRKVKPMATSLQGLGRSFLNAECMDFDQAMVLLSPLFRIITVLFFSSL